MFHITTAKQLFCRSVQRNGECSNHIKDRIPGLERDTGLTILSHLAEQNDGHFTSGHNSSIYDTVISKAEE